MTVRLPAAYVLERAGGVRVAIRRDLVPRLAPWLLAPTFALPPGAEPLDGGRGAAWRVELPDGLRVVVRRYRRGGIVARVVRESYLGPRPRPLRELAVTEEVRRRGVRAPEVLAARVEGGLVYRGALVTAEVVGARTLIDALRGAAGEAERCALAARAGRALAALHDAGVYHADLNLTNLLVAPGGTGELVVVDFDRARLRRGPLGPRARRRNLARLRRSLAKLDPGGVLGGPTVRGAFAGAYGAPGGSPCAS